MLTLSPLVTCYLIFLALVLGLVFGSFCNAWAWRVVHHESIARGRSHCPRCGHTLAPRDLIPLISWLTLRGRCRYCGAPIPARYPLAEGICCLYFVTILLRWDVGIPLVRFLALGCLLLVLSLVDWDTRELPDGLVLAVALLALLRLPVEGLLPGLKSALLGGATLFVPLMVLVLVMDKVLGRESMGGGDIKLLTALGFHFGPAQSLFLVIVACLMGLGFIRGRRGKEFPFGPAISLAAWVTALAGGPVVTWYLGLFG